MGVRVAKSSGSKDGESEVKQMDISADVLCGGILSFFLFDLGWPDNVI